MSKKCKAYSASRLGLETPDNRKAFYAGWDAALSAPQPSAVPVAWVDQKHLDWLAESPDNLTGAGLSARQRSASMVPLYTADQLAAAVLRATLAERERCAKVCEAEEDDSSNWRTESAVAHRIAAAIRAGETK